MASLFQGCTLTKVLVAASGLATWACLTRASGGALPSVGVAAPPSGASTWCQLVPLNTLAYPSYPTLLIGSVCLIVFRQLERYLGTRKFGAVLLLLFSLTHVLKHLLQARPTGPVPVLVALGLLYLQHVPPMLNISLLGLRVSEHVSVPTALLHLLMTGGSAAQDASIGFAAAMVWAALFSRATIPTSVVRRLSFLDGLLATPLDPLFRREYAQQEGERGSTRAGRVRQTSGMGARYAEQLLGAGGRVQQQRPPTQDNVDALVAMGFPAESARWALTQTGNDVQAAVELLTNSAR